MRVTHREQTRIHGRRRVFIVEPDSAQSREALRVLAEAGYECESFTEPDTGLARLGQSDAEVLVINLASVENAGEMLRRIAREAPEAAVILTVAHPAVSAAIAALGQGAFDYITKPINPDELTAAVDRALEMVTLRHENRLLHEQLDVASMSAAFVAESPAGRALAGIIRRAAPANSPVVIEGESGTGKELVARMLHHWSMRAGAPFVKLNFKLLSSVGWLPGGPQALHRPGAGADTVVAEHVERARGGTLFLDEVAEAGPEFQSLMLGLVGEGESAGRSAVSGRRAVRIVVSSSTPLADEVAARRFRADLYFALNVIPIRVPPLRDRREDILPLARHFLARHTAESGRAMTLSGEAEQALSAYAWPGNVRELQNVIERAVVMSPGERIPADALLLGPPPRRDEPPQPSVSPQLSAPPPPPRAQAAEAAPAVETAAPEPAAQAESPADETLQATLDRAAAQRIRKALEAAKGDRNDAAAALGIDRATLQRLIKRLGL